MPFQAPGNRPFGTLSAAILASATSLTLTSGHGARFHAITAGDFYYLILVDTNETDLDDNWEIVKATARSSDTFTIERGFDGTSPKAFPRTPNNTVTRVRVFAPMSELQMRMFMTGGGAVVSAAMPTLTVDSPELLLLTPTAAGNCDLPTTNVNAGWVAEIHNLSSTGANVITVRASGGTTVCLLPAGSSVRLRAIQDAPTTNAHWKPEGSFIDDSSLFVYGGTSTKSFKPMGAIDVNTTQVSRPNPNNDALMSYTLPGGTLGENGEVLCIYAAFGGVAGAHAPDFAWGTITDADLDFGASALTVELFSFVVAVRVGAASAKLIGILIHDRDNTTGTGSDYGVVSDSLVSDLIIGFNTSTSGAGTATQEIMAVALVP